MSDMRAVPVKYNSIRMDGGTDLITPTLNLKPGICRAAINFEVSTVGGYSRIQGYERLDGHTSPSSATFLILTVSGNTLPALGVTITGATSNATGVLIAITAAYFVLTKVTGTFNGTEVLNVSGSPVATQTGFTGAGTPKLVAQYKALAANNYRADIAAPAGSGAALGAFYFNGVNYCFRNNAGGTAAVMFRSSASGWTAVAFGYELSFTAASTTPAEGATVTQGAVSAVVRRVVLQSGAYAGGTAAGRLIIDAPTGGNFAAGAFTAGFTATCSGAETAITLAPSGKYQFETANFGGTSSTVRVYGCDGVNRGFEFDGTTFVPITTGTTPDTPKFLENHKRHLIWAIGSSIIHSAPGLPYDYTAISGAGEIATGDTITGLLEMPGAQTTGTLGVFQRTNTLMLYGTGLSSWNLVYYNTGTGAIPYSCQNMSQTYALDDRGLITLQTTLDFGNFTSSTLTAAMRPFIISNRSLLNCSVLNREKSQYRMYFSNGLALYSTILNAQYRGSMEVYLPVAISNIWEGTKTNGDEIILACGADGMVYQMDIGTSFDGANIGASLTLQYNHMNSPRILNRYRKCALEMIGSSYAEVAFTYTLGYGKTEYQQPSPTSYNSNMLVSNWDLSNWDTFFWDASNLIPLECEMTGTAENVALTFASIGDYMDSFTVNSAIIHHSPRRGLR